MTTKRAAPKPAEKPDATRKPRRRAKGFPSKVPVLHVYYDLDPRADLDSEDAAGMMSTGPSGKSIKISKCQNEPAMWAGSFWHEWSHAVLHELGYAEDSVNEGKVEGLARAITELFADHHGRELLQMLLRHVPPKGG